MKTLKRAYTPFRYHIPQHLIPKLRALRARQQDWGEPIDSEDVVHLYYGMGPAGFLALDGRVLVDPYDWDEEDSPVRSDDPKEAWSAIVVGAKVLGVSRTA